MIASEVFYFMHESNVVLLCFLFLPVDPVTYIVTNITFFVIISIYCQAYMKPVTSSSLRYIWRLCDSQDMMLKRTSKSVTLGMPISCPACRACQIQLASRSACPACQTRGAKTGNELSTRREIWDLSLARSILGCKGMNLFFPCL